MARKKSKRKKKKKSKVQTRQTPMWGLSVIYFKGGFIMATAIPTVPATPAAEPTPDLAVVMKALADEVTVAMGKLAAVTAELTAQKADRVQHRQMTESLAAGLAAAANPPDAHIRAAMEAIDRLRQAVANVNINP